MRDKLIKSLKTMAHDLANIEADQDLHELLEMTRSIYDKLVILEYLTKNIDQLEGEELDLTIDERQEGSYSTGLEDEISDVKFSESERIEEIQPPSKEEIIEVEQDEKHDDSLELNIDEINIDEKEDELENLFEPKFDSIKEDFSQKDEFKDTISLDETEKLFETKREDSKPVSLNDRLLGKKIQVGLNDRIAFVNSLFDFNQADFNKTLNHLNTFETEIEAKQYIEEEVKKQFDWTGKETLEERFILLVEKRFL